MTTMLKKYFIMAIAAGLALVACSEKFDEPGIQPAGSDNVHTLSVGIEAGTYTPAEGGTKASMEAVIRVNWTANDEVSVVNATKGKILGGSLKAKESGTSVTFEGTVTGTIDNGDRLYYIYPKLNNTEETDFENTGYDQKLSDQKYDATKPNEVCFFGYAEDVAGTATISKKIQFNLVTAYAHLNMSNLPAKGAPLTSIDISNVNEGFTWKLSNKNLSAEPYAGNNGISVTCTNYNITQAGNAVARFALPASAASQQARVITVNKAYKNDGYTVKELEKASYHNQLYTSWESNVSVTTEASKTKVSISNGGSADVAEGVIPVADAFVANKETEIGIGGVGTVTFDATATAKIKSNAGAEGSTNVFFKVEDVTETKPVQDANLVYEVTMKTVDEKGVEVFKEGKAEGVATVTVPLGEEVASVTSVALVNESGQEISGGVVAGTVKFDAGILTFDVNHFSKYAIKYTLKSGEDNYVAQIGSRKYTSLANAVAAVPANNSKTTITMIDNHSMTEGVTIPSNKTIILELNGKTIEYITDKTVWTALITNRGTLTIKDLTDVDGNGSGTGKIAFTALNPDLREIPGYASNTITNYGKLTVKSGLIVNLTEEGAACYPVENDANGGPATLVIDGGRFYREIGNALRVVSFSPNLNEVTINGGIFESKHYAVWLQLPQNDSNIKPSCSVKINGGIFTGEYAFCDYSFGASFENTKYEINGGQFNGDVLCSGATVNVSDGSFDGKYYGLISYGKNTTISGGSFDGSYYGLYTSGANVNISGGSFHGNYYGLYASQANVNISGGSFEGSEYGLYSKSGAITISGGSFNGSAGYSIVCFGENVDISDGVFKSNVYIKESTNASITGGKFDTDIRASQTVWNKIISGGIFKTLVDTEDSYSYWPYEICDGKNYYDLDESDPAYAEGYRYIVQ